MGRSLLRFFLLLLLIAALAMLAVWAALRLSPIGSFVPRKLAGGLVCPSDGLPPCQKPVLPKQIAAKCASSGPHSVEDFKAIRKEMDFSQVCASVGQPDWVTGSGVSIYVYELSGGTAVLIGFAGEQQLLYVHYVHQDGGVTNLLEE